MSALARKLQSEIFDSLPNKPYCTDSMGITYIRAKKNAAGRRYLQLNPPKMLKYLIFDIDREGGVLAWEHSSLPPPFWSSKNRVNAHAHIVYRLESPVCTSDIAKLKPLRFAAAIQSAMTERLNADRGFAGLLTKNPLHSHWDNTFWTEHEYTLEELADFLDLKGHPIRGVEAVGLGRNCALFDECRKWSYRAIRHFWGPEYSGAWERAVYERVESLNSQFTDPLPVAEMKSIAKSIARWTYKRFTPAGYSEYQARVGALGGKAGSIEDKAKAGRLGGEVSKGGGRSIDASSEQQTQPWVALGISRRTYYNRKKSGEI